MTVRTRSTSSVQETGTCSITGTQRSSTVGSEWVPIEYEQTYTKPHETRTTTDTVTADYKKRSARGEIINNPYESNYALITPPQPGSFARSYTKLDAEGQPWGTRWSGGAYVLTEENLGPIIDPSWVNTQLADTIESLKATAVTAAHANASNCELSTTMVLAEGNKTIASMGELMKRAWSILRAVKKADLAYLRKQISKKELSDRYMELRYAIRPLVIDANNIVAAVDKSLVWNNSRKTFRGFQKHSYAFADTVALTGVANATGVVDRTVEVNTTVRAGVLTEIVNSGLATWGTDQILETVWEIIPFSFIVDWFINVGDTLAAWTPTLGVQERASWVVIKQTATYKNTLGSVQSTLTGYTVNTISMDGHYGRTYVNTVREPNPQLSYWPRFSVRLNSLKLLDLGIIGRNFLR